MFVPFRGITNRGALVSVGACIVLALIYEDMTSRENAEKEIARQRARAQSPWQQIADGEEANKRR